MANKPFEDRRDLSTKFHIYLRGTEVDRLEEIHKKPYSKVIPELVRKHLKKYDNS